MDQMLLEISAKGENVLRPIKIITIAGGCNIMFGTKFLHPLKLLNLFLLITAMVGCFSQIHFFWHHRHQSFDVYIEAILIFFQIFISMYKLWLFTFSQQRLYKMIQSVQTSNILKDLEIFELNLANKSKIVKDICKILHGSWYDIKLQLTFFISSVFGILVWYIAESLAVNIYNIYYSHQEFEVRFPFPASFPNWHVRDTKVSYIISVVEYLIICIEAYFSAVCAIAFTGIFPIISVHCLALLKILRTLISYSTTYHVYQRDRVRYLQACIKLHQQINEFCNELNLLYRMPALAMFLVSCLVICLLTFQASVDLGKDVSTIIKVALYVSASFFEVGIFCFNGQRITSESELLSSEIYNNEWYDENDHFKFMTQIMILRSDQSITMDVGGFATMSLVTFLSILRSSASYFLFLQKCM